MGTEIHPVITFIPESTERQKGTVGWEQSLLLAIPPAPSKCATKESSHQQGEAWCSAWQSVGFSWCIQVCILNCDLLRRKWGKFSDLSPQIIRQRQTHLLKLKKNSLNYLNALNLTGKKHSHKKLSPLSYKSHHKSKLLIKVSEAEQLLSALKIQIRIQTHRAPATAAQNFRRLYGELAGSRWFLWRVPWPCAGPGGIWREGTASWSTPCGRCSPAPRSARSRAGTAAGSGRWPRQRTGSGPLCCCSWPGEEKEEATSIQAVHPLALTAKYLFPGMFISSTKSLRQQAKWPVNICIYPHSEDQQCMTKALWDVGNSHSSTPPSAKDFWL